MTATSPDDRWLTVKEVAAMLHMSANGLYMWRRTGKGPTAVPVGRKWLYPESGVREYLAGLVAAAERAAEFAREAAERGAA
jgi:predicted DNA-binding transcriptional regulator AlpA